MLDTEHLLFNIWNSSSRVFLLCLSENMCVILSYPLLSAVVNKKGYNRIEVTDEVEDDWVELILSAPPAPMAEGCTPGYYNGEGDETPELKSRMKSFAGHPAGPLAFFQYMQEWRSDGNFDGLTFGHKSTSKL